MADRLKVGHWVYDEVDQCECKIMRLGTECEVLYDNDPFIHTRNAIFLHPLVHPNTLGVWDDPENVWRPACLKS